MKADELREKYLKFFKSKGHAIIPSASLIPENDPTVLFTTAGMHPLVPYLMGEKHPGGKRLVNSQKSIRTTDIEDVGDHWHNTFFEMLGNWSLGDYFKKEALGWSWEFLTDKKWLGLEPQRIYVTVFEGDEDAPKDEESIQIWKDIFKTVEIDAKEGDRIFVYPKEENWWGPAGVTGPCGPDSEMFYDTLREPCGDSCEPKCSCGKYVEIWNDVFMQYNKTADGKYEPLKQQNVDTGMGLERTTAVLQGHDNTYETELFQPIIKEIEKITSKGFKDDNETTRLMSIVADHIRAAVFILGDEKGIVPSNLDQGYILRRLIRIAIRKLKQLGTEENVTVQISEKVINTLKHIYPEIEQNKKFIFEQLKLEEEAFRKTLTRGLKEFEKMCEDKVIDGKEAFILFTTYGFPFEMTQNLASEKGVEIKVEEFNEEFKKHQELSRTASEGKFKGGLADHSETATKYHTATHLLLAALRKVLGDHVQQKGSNITDKRLRFDFSHTEKLTDEQKKEVENIVNDAIKNDYEVKFEEMTLDEAKQAGAVGVFEHKYGEKVKVYTVFNPNTQEVYSKEVCGGPHIEKTSTIGYFKIKKEESSSSGVRRIKAVLS
ncbi:alanine--tRNA ligase [Patescibacteria group bacterium]|nr:alanine--tRNA ligase [Patescibacteria group bacterium]